MNGRDVVFQLLDLVAEQRLNLLLAGPTGVGKTTAVHEWAASRGLDVALVPCGSGDPEPDLYGYLAPNPAGGWRFVPSAAHRVVQEGRGVLLLDEVNFISQSALARLHSALDWRRLWVNPVAGEVLPLQDVVVVATMNPGEGFTLPRPIRLSRFVHWKVEPSGEIIRNLLGPRYADLAESWKSAGLGYARAKITRLVADRIGHQAAAAELQAAAAEESEASNLIAGFIKAGDEKGGDQ